MKIPIFMTVCSALVFFAPLSASAEAPTVILHFDFQADFSGGVATVEIDGEEVFTKEVKTNPVTGIAGRFIYPTNREILHVIIKHKRIARAIDIQPRKGAYLGIELKRGNITVMQQRKPFLYD